MSVRLFGFLVVSVLDIRGVGLLFRDIWYVELELFCLRFGIVRVDSFVMVVLCGVLEI